MSQEQKFKITCKRCRHYEVVSKQKHDQLQETGNFDCKVCRQLKELPTSIKPLRECGVCHQVWHKQDGLDCPKGCDYQPSSIKMVIDPKNQWIPDKRRKMGWEGFDGTEFEKEMSKTESENKRKEFQNALSRAQAPVKTYELMKEFVEGQNAINEKIIKTMDTMTDLMGKLAPKEDDDVQ